MFFDDLKRTSAAKSVGLQARRVHVEELRRQLKADESPVAT
jgi:hypothetical protein